MTVMMKTTTQGTRSTYSDLEYITGLKAGDSKITHSFFYSLCGYTLNDIRWSLMQGHVDYDELVNELYLYLSLDNWHKLDTFEGKNGCTLRSWMVRLCWRFFLQRRDMLLFSSSESEGRKEYGETYDNLQLEISMDIETTFKRMTNKRYVQLLVWMLVDGYNADEVTERLSTPVSNVYNIKHRAILQFVETYNRC